MTFATPIGVVVILAASFMAIAMYGAGQVEMLVIPLFIGVFGIFLTIVGGIIDRNSVAKQTELFRLEYEVISTIIAGTIGREEETDEEEGED